MEFVWMGYVEREQGEGEVTLCWRGRQETDHRQSEKADVLQWKHKPDKPCQSQIVLVHWCKPANGPLSEIAHHSKNTVWLTQKATSHAFLLPFQTHYLCVALDGLQKICWSIHTNSIQNFTLLLDHSFCDSFGIPGYFRVKHQAHDLPKEKKNRGKIASRPQSSTPPP